MKNKINFLFEDIILSVVRAAFLLASSLSGALEHAPFEASEISNFKTLAIYACAFSEDSQTKLNAIDLHYFSKIIMTETVDKIRFEGDCRLEKTPTQEWKGQHLVFEIDKIEFAEKSRTRSEFILNGIVGEKGFEFVFETHAENSQSRNVYPVYFRFYSLNLAAKALVTAEFYDLALQISKELNPTNKDLYAKKWANQNQKSISFQGMGKRDGQNSILISPDGNDFYLYFYSIPEIAWGFHQKDIQNLKADAVYFDQILGMKDVILGCSYFVDTNHKPFSKMECLKRMADMTFF